MISNSSRTKNRLNRYYWLFQVTGGGKVYGYKVEPESMASVDNDGMVSVLSGPGTITYTAGMVKSMHNNHTAKVK